MGATFTSDLEHLANPEWSGESLNMEDTDTDVLKRSLQQMLTIRVVEEKIGEQVQLGAVKTPCHLAIGQEAVAVGIASALRVDDRVFGNHRSHGQFLAMGGGLYDLISEVFGKRDGASKGMGGSMHLFGGGVGFHGSVPIVGATIPIAVGAALSAKLDGSDLVAVAFFGDGACEEGVFHESLNLASVYELPVLFVVENNLFSSHLDIQLRQPSDSVERFAKAHRVHGRVIDGNNLIEVTNVVRDVVAGIRAGGRPALIEAVTFRHRGHVGPKEDIDVGVNRKMEDVSNWKRRCPIARLAEALRSAGCLVDGELGRMRSELESNVDELIERAKRAPFPEASALLDNVYASR